MRPGTVRVLLIAPPPDCLGGQAIQAIRLKQCLEAWPGVTIEFQPLNPAPPRPLRLVRRIKFVRTVFALAQYSAALAVRVPRYDVLHVFSASYWSYTLWTLPALFFTRLYRRKIVVNYRDGRGGQHLAGWRSAVPTLSWMDAIVVPSRYLVEVFAGSGLRAQAIVNIIDPSGFRFRPRRRLRPLFLHNRRLEPLYNVHCTLRAFKIVQERFPDASLVVAHDGPSREALEEFARSIGLKNCRFVGEIPHDQVPALYDAADIYLTSPDLDCMPGSLLECFASGLPIVATAAGGIPYLAEHERTALLVPCGDHKALAEAAIRLLTDESLVERLTTNALEACRRYSAAAVRDQWLALYHRLAERRFEPTAASCEADLGGGIR